jgi:hypothetical protein
MTHWESRQRTERPVARPFPLAAALKDLRALYRELARAQQEIARVGRKLADLEVRWKKEGGTLLNSGKAELARLRRWLGMVVNKERLPRGPSWRSV